MLKQLTQLSLIGLLSCTPNRQLINEPITMTPPIVQQAAQSKSRMEDIRWWGFTIEQDNLRYIHDIRSNNILCKLELGNDARLHDYGCNGSVDIIFDSEGMYMCNRDNDRRCNFAGSILYEKKILLNVAKTLHEWELHGGQDALRNYD